jgi:hypothetical protein
VADELTYSARITGARSPEVEVLFRCACADPVDLDRVGVLIQEKLKWDALAEAAEYHGLAPILYSAANRSCPELVPETVVRHLRNCYRDSAKRNLIFTAKLLALLDAFEAEGIAVVPLKGAALAESLYSDPVSRPFSDLDLLVRKQDVPAALRVLTRAGYRLGAHLARLPMQTLLSLQFEVLLRQEQTAPVDLQWEIGRADYPFCFDMEILWRSLGRSQIAGREVPSLSPEGLLLFLCVHGAKHVWSRLQWLGDVARLARAQPDWTGTLELATGAGCERPLLLGLLLAHKLLDASVPEAILGRARRAEPVQRLARQVVLRLNRIPPAEPESLEITTFNARLAERTWKKVRHYAALLKAPTEVELELLPLPERLFFLYYPLRAARLALKYGLWLARG